MTSAPPSCISTSLDAGPVLDGYDVTAYFTIGDAMLGDASITAEYGNFTFRFASEAARSTPGSTI